jgi:predicted Zn-dependent peptidase
MDTQIVLGFEGRAYHVRDYYASQVLSMILGGGMSSRLFQEVREKRGLCYSVYAFHWGFSDTGVFGIHAATGKEDIPELVPLLVKELHRAGDPSTRRNWTAPAPSTGRRSSCRRKARPAAPRRSRANSCFTGGRSRWKS